MDVLSRNYVSFLGLIVVVTDTPNGRLAISMSGTRGYEGVANGQCFIYEDL